MFEEMVAPQGFDEDGDFLPLISMEEEDESQLNDAFPEVLPILPLKNTVLFPGIVIPITVGRDKSIKAVNKAYDEGRLVAVLSQRAIALTIATTGLLICGGFISYSMIGFWFVEAGRAPRAARSRGRCGPRRSRVQARDPWP